MSEDDESRRERIIRHMNADHQDSIAAYARHFASLPDPEASTALMSDITFSSITLTTPNRDAISISLNPPLTSWSEVRPRLVAMSEEATRNKGSKYVSVTRFIYPTPFGWLVAFLVAFSWYTFWSPAHLARGSWVRKYHLWDWHALADFLMEYGDICFWMIIGIHVTETVVLWRTRLRSGRYGGKMGFGTKCLWMLGTFTEGFGTFVRFDEEVRRLKREAEGK